MSNRKRKKDSKNKKLKQQKSHYVGIETVEKLIVLILIFVVFMLFDMDVNSHFTLPKLQAITICMIFLSITFFIKVKNNTVHALPISVLTVLSMLFIWWSVSTSQALIPSIALEGEPGRYNGFYTHVLLIILFVTMAQSRINHKELRVLINAIYLLTLVLCLHAISQYFNIDPILEASVSRPFATIGNPVALGVILIMVIPFVLIDIIEQPANSYKLVSLTLLILFLFTLFITGSRGPWLGLIAGLIFLIAFYWQYLKQLKFVSIKYTAICLGLLGILIYALVDWSSLNDRFTYDASIKVRLMYFKSAFEMILDSPVFGAGFESFRLMYPAYRPIEDALISGRDTTPTMVHNDFLQLATDNGVLALILFLVFICLVISYLYRTIKVSLKIKPVLIAVIISIIAYLAQGMSGWLEISSLFFFWFILGVGVAVASSSHSNNQQEVNLIPQYIFSVVSIIFLIFYLLQINTFFQLEKNTRLMSGYHSGGVINKTNIYLTRLKKLSQGNAYYLDKIGGIYLDRLSRSSKDINFNYRQAHKYFLLAQEANPYNPYFRLNLMITDTLAIRRSVITEPSPETTINIREVELLDPNNPTVYETRARLYAAINRPVKQALDLVKVKELLQEK